MTVFRTFLKILNKNKFIVLMYSVLLIAFGGFNAKTNDNTMNFEAQKGDVAIINYDEEKGITKDLIKYISDNSNVKDIDNTKDALNDALFYRDVNYIIYIPKNFNEDFMNGNDPKIEIKSTGDYNSSLVNILLTRYLKVAKSYQKSGYQEDELINKINTTLALESNVEITSKLDSDGLTRAAGYYNFASYSILAALVYVICLILSSFKDINIQKRTIVSSSNYKKINRQLLLSNISFSLVLWLVYVIVSMFLMGKTMFSIHGLMYIFNTLAFTLCATCLAMLISSLVTNKDAINGIVNVVALGSSFLCGAFVPMNFLPDSVLKIAHVLPSYYFISSNETIKVIEEFNFESLKPIIGNTIALVIFSIIFIVITNIITKKKQRIG